MQPLRFDALPLKVVLGDQQLPVIAPTLIEVQPQPGDFGFEKEIAKRIEYWQRMRKKLEHRKEDQSE